MTGVQTILSNQNASVDVITPTYTTEQRGAWSLDVNILEACNRNLTITMEVSNDGVVWRCYKIIKEKISGTVGKGWVCDSLPYDYVRFEVYSNATTGRYKILFNERSQ